MRKVIIIFLLAVSMMLVACGGESLTDEERAIIEAFRNEEEVRADRASTLSNDMIWAIDVVDEALIVLEFIAQLPHGQIDEAFESAFSIREMAELDRAAEIFIRYEIFDVDLETDNVGISSDIAMLLNSDEATILERYLNFLMAIVPTFDASVWDIPHPPEIPQIFLPGDFRLVSLDAMVANLAPRPNNRIDSLVVEVVVGLNAVVDEDELEDFYDEFNRSLSVARAIALDVFVSRTYEEMRTLEGRQETAEIIKHRLQEAFDSNLIVQVFFSEWNAIRGSE